MGSSNSKSNAPESSSSGHRRSYSKGSKIFRSSCIRPPSSGSPDSDNDNDNDKENDEQASDHQAKENGSDGQCAEVTTSDLNSKAERKKKVKGKQSDELTRVSSNMQLDEWGQSIVSDTISGGGSSSSRAFSSRSLNRSSRYLSRFSFFPGNMSFRLSRATSLGSSRAYPESSTSSTISNDEELHPHRRSSSGLFNRNKTPQGCDFFPACLINRSPRSRHEDFASENLGCSSSASVFSDNLRDSQITSTQELARDTIETRFNDRRTEAREPVERNVRFSRTLSVGRLRDRVLRRSSFPDLISCPLQQEMEVGDTSEDREANRRQALGGGTGVQASNENALFSPTPSGYTPSIISSSLYDNQNFELETTRVRESRYHDLLEHRSNFLERRRRIRSQVRALQRMGSRFENLSGHERSCILSGQHRTGHCACRLNTRDSNDGTSAGDSISRIVLLADALFEVLDEIHQQSVVLSSQPSLSSIGSIPAPNEVVESLPLKLYRKSQKHLNEEDAQCYICLVEYEDGDGVRVLPCHHEFHRSCIDKWLKEIHRICPLCRGDICKSDSLPAESLEVGG